MAVRYIFTFLFLFGLAHLSKGQERVTTVGLQLRPIIPSILFNTGPEQIFQGNQEYEFRYRPSYTFGMTIRRGITNTFSFETGINYVRRNFSYSVTDGDSLVSAGTPFSLEDDFSIIGYEIPMLGLVYIRLGEQVYMNAAFGFSLDMYPSNVGSGDFETLSQVSRRRSWLQSSLLANVGWEYRTKESGYFYVGASFHRPFQSIYRSNIRYQTELTTEQIGTDISGNYLTVDFRYFFHEDPVKKGARKKKKTEEKNLRYYRKLQRLQQKSGATPAPDNK